MYVIGFRLLESAFVLLMKSTYFCSENFSFLSPMNVGNLLNCVTSCVLYVCAS